LRHYGSWLARGALTRDGVRQLLVLWVILVRESPSIAFNVFAKDVPAELFRRLRRRLFNLFGRQGAQQEPRVDQLFPVGKLDRSE
jgi:hypothetical protein